MARMQASATSHNIFMLFVMYKICHRIFFLSWSLWFMLIIKWLSRRVFRSQPSHYFRLCFIFSLPFNGIRKKRIFYVFGKCPGPGRGRIKTFFYVHNVASFSGWVIFAEFACEYGILAFNSSQQLKTSLRISLPNFHDFGWNKKFTVLMNFQNKKRCRPKKSHQLSLL